MSHTEAVLEVTGISKRYGTLEVLKDLNFTLGPGVHALLGPNGAGKTTLVNILSTLVAADSGTARVLGMDVRQQRRAVQQAISVTGQFASVDEVLTGRENLVMMGVLLGLDPRSARRRASELLADFGLTEAATNPVGTYSGGMRRKLDLAVSLVCPPGLLFLDEPTTGLDTRSRQALWDQITDLAARGTSILLTTQYLEEADALADRILVLDHGTIVADGTAAELKALAGGIQLQVRDEQGHVLASAATDGTATDLARASSALARSHPRAAVFLQRPSLDDAFLQLTGRAPVETDDSGQRSPA